MRYWLAFIGLCCMLPGMAVEIANLPPTTAPQFDITWQLTVNNKRALPFTLQLSAGKQPVYQLQVTAVNARWLQKTGKATAICAAAPLALHTGTSYQVTLKRRQDTVALLLNHRLIFTAPAPSSQEERVIVYQTPTGMTVADARYQEVEAHFFGDDFMRPEAPHGTVDKPWVEDSTWEVAHYGKDNPSRDPKTGNTTPNPWALSLFQVVEATTNGFWFLYTGTGPSWIVANPTMVQPNWDRYFVQAAVRTEYDSAVGIIAAYQDNNNYLLFRWRPRDVSGTDTSPRATLLAVIDGKEHVLATSRQGFYPGQWYTLRLNLSWQRIEACVDGVPFLSAENPGPIEGRVGLYADGAANPHRPRLDDLTATMYLVTDAKTGKVLNDAADAMRTTSTIYFDDVHIGDWVSIDNIVQAAYPKTTSGKWNENHGVLTAETAGRVVTGQSTWDRYTISGRVRIPQHGTAGVLIKLDPAHTGYGWLISPDGQQLQPINGTIWGSAVDRSSINVLPGEWATIRVEADGPSIACYLNGQRVLEAFDRKHMAGQCGVLASCAGVQFDSFAVTPLTAALTGVEVHDGFVGDPWMATWASAEADWYPASPHQGYLILDSVSGKKADPGPAGPLLTDVPGLYWNKGGYYHDIRVKIPLTPATVSGQSLYLAHNYDEKNAYRIQLTCTAGKGLATLYRQDIAIGQYPFKLTDHTRLLLERRGAYLLLTAQEMDPTDTSTDPDAIHEEHLFTYRDAQPLPAEMVGFLVTDAKLPAAKIVVDSDRIQDTFEQSPATWASQSGVWAVMARYSCQPKWNWYGGFGAGTPTVWNKMRLDGDQNVEVYMGIKMQYDNMPDVEAKRFRDMNVSICTDGKNVNSGYTVIRAGHLDGQTVTMLLRKGVLVKTSTKPDDLIPPGGHRQWFATRIEKRGGEIKVFLDNHLTFTYVDPEPLTGGYAAFWTVNNGIMIGRADISAEHMSMGSPQAASQLVSQQDLPPRPEPKVTIGETPVKLATFEADFDGWQQRPGLSAALERERDTEPTHGTNTYLKLVNSYPAGDFSVTMSDSPVDLAAQPIFHADYNFDPGAKINLYIRYRSTWYEFLLTGVAAEDDVRTAGRIPLQTDGAWHTVHTDIGTLLSQAIAKQTGATPTDLIAQDIIFADWGTSSDLRVYGCGLNTGGTAIRFDNVGFLPALKGEVVVHQDNK
ncbi:MAG TPA: family 16 glycoside hydrolase [Armatimonadota bacterium]|nr:family 16 glycoside hydrolase [Armatimonadota bacterium]